MEEKIIRNKNLQSYNSFGLKAFAKKYITIPSEEFLIYFIGTGKLTNEKILVLGGGSNMLFTGDFAGIVLHNAIQGINLVHEDEQNVIIKVGGGENWHELVLYCTDKNWGGIENLSLIPGNAGAAPIQNIGAYGVELKNVFFALDFIHFDSGELESFNEEQCEFSYRNSIFKRELKGKGMITHIYLKLSKNHVPITRYGAIKEVLDAKSILTPSIKDVSDAVISIRKSKLPDPKKIGNSGSFFKNPVVSNELYNSLKLKYPDIPGYPEGNRDIKVPAAWLIENAGWKGFRDGEIGVHDKHALVLVNYGGGSGKEILNLAHKIIDSVYKKYTIQLEPEVNII